MRRRNSNDSDAEIVVVSFWFSSYGIMLLVWFNVAANWSILDVPWNMNLALLSYYLAILRE